MKKLKKILIIVLIFGIFVLLGLVLLRGKARSPSSTVEPSSSPVPTFAAPSEETLEINSVTVNNFYKEAEKTLPSGDVLLVDDSRYQIVYLTNFNKFLITVISGSYNEVKDEAEEQFLKTLDINKTSACFLDVEVTTIVTTDTEFNGKRLPLSFCTDLP